MSMNPWLEVADGLDRRVEVPVEAPRTVPRVRFSLPPAPGVVPPLGYADQLDRVGVDAQPDLWTLGVHGGAGESALAAALPGALHAGHKWPITNDGTTAPVLLVARSNAAGLRAAQRAARDWGSHALPTVGLVGLAVIADAPGRLPRPLRNFADLVAGAVPFMWRLPWDESWRLDAEPSPDTAGPQLARALHALRTSIFIDLPSTDTAD